jgi:hypothetical protein
MAGFVLLCLPETRGVPLDNMEALLDVWLEEHPCSTCEAAGRERAGPGGEETCGGYWKAGCGDGGNREEAAVTGGEGDWLVVNEHRVKEKQKNRSMDYR